MTIKTLERETIERIAAGEVITRPDSVVTELVENALDAGATRIEITVENGGCDLIRVVDDGHGMNETDAALCVDRHTTSKIEGWSDVESVESLGFRGEALPSIANVAHLELTTKEEGAVAGTRVAVDETKSVETAGHSVGTTVTASDLFSELPARRKSLGSPSQEFARISQTISWYALVRPDVCFRLVHEERTTLSTPGTGLTDVILSVYDRSVAAQSTPFEFEGRENGLRVNGLLVYPAVTRSAARHVYTAVNDRAVPHATIRDAIRAGYGSLLPSDRYPIAVVSVSVPTEFVDVNVHPSKNDVRFTEEEQVASCVKRAVSRALSDVDLSRRDEFEFDAEPISPETDPNGLSPFDELSVIGQFRELYLLCETGDELLVVDQHAAHERVTYEQLRERAAGAINSVTLDPPLTLSLTPAEAATIKANRDAIEAVGFRLEAFGSDTYRVTAMPAPLGRVADSEAVHDTLDSFFTGEAPDDPRDALLAELACHPSFKAGDALSRDDAYDLVRQLGTCEQPFACPHGRPTMLTIEETTLARSFERESTRFV